MRKIWIAVLALGCLTGLAAENAAPAPEKGPGPGPSKEMRGMPPRGPRPRWRGEDMYWRVFNRMSREERRSMMELQAKDPAAFQQQMKQRVEALRRDDEAMRKKIDALAQRCRTGSDAEKAAAKAELTRIFRAEFVRRLADSRRHLQEMQRRMQKLIESLKAKEANADQEIPKMVEDCIQGRRPGPPPSGMRRMPPPELPPPELPPPSSGMRQMPPPPPLPLPLPQPELPPPPPSR